MQVYPRYYRRWKLGEKLKKKIKWMQENVVAGGKAAHYYSYDVAQKKWVNADNSEVEPKFKSGRYGHSTGTQCRANIINESQQARKARGRSPWSPPETRAGNLSPGSRNTPPPLEEWADDDDVRLYNRSSQRTTTGRARRSLYEEFVASEEAAANALERHEESAKIRIRGGFSPEGTPRPEKYRRSAASDDDE